MASLILGDNQTLKTENNGKNWESSLDGATDYITLPNKEKLICLNSGLFMLGLDGILKNLNIKDPFKIYVEEDGKTIVTTKNGDGYRGYPPNLKEYFNGFVGEPTPNGIIGNGVLDLDGNMITSEKSSILNDNVLSSVLKIKGLQEKDVDKVTTYILNNILYPYISNKCVGFTIFPIGDVTIKNNDTVFIKTSENFFKQVQSSFINWQEDVGMNPINKITIGELLPEEKKSFVQTDTIDKVSYLKAKRETLEIIEEVKKAIQSKNSNIVNNIEPNLMSEVIRKSPEEMIENNVEAYKEYVNLSKQTNISFLNLITERTYTFDEYSLRKLIKNAVYECVSSLSGYVKINLLKAIRNKEEYFDILSMPFKYSYRNGVINALKKYADEVKSKTKEINDKNDEDLIALAASYYKVSERNRLIKESYSILKNIIDNFDYSNVATKYNECEKDIDNFINESKETDDVVSLYNEYDFLYRNYDFKMLPMVAFKKINETFKKELIKTIDNIIIVSDFYKANILPLSEVEQKNTLNYIREILEKFIERCLELFIKCYNETDKTIGNIIENQNRYLKNWCRECKNENKYYNDRLLPKLEKQTKFVLSKFLNNLLESYNSQKEVL